MSLRQAIDMALARHPSVAAAASGVQAASARIEQARGGFLPRVDYSESFQQSNNPVFVFSSLLTQRRFDEENFRIGALNRPDSISNFQSVVAVEQTLWDAGRTRGTIRAAQAGREIASEDARRTRLDLTARVAQSYYGAVLAAEAARIASQSVKSAEADLERAAAVRKAGLSTDVDVLSIRVHLAQMREQLIRREADLEVARAALNEALGLPLDTPHTLITPLEQAGAARALEEYERAALQARPEVLQSRLAVDLADAQRKQARASLWPQVIARGAFEADRGRFYEQGGGNWFAGLSLRWNLFNGGADKARVAEADHAIARARSFEQQAAAGIRLELRRAQSNYEAAKARLEVAGSAVAMAEESLRITKNRYGSGLNTVTDLLRTETALLEARTRRLTAIHDLRLALIGLELAAGTLQPDSEVLQ